MGLVDADRELVSRLLVIITLVGRPDLTTPVLIEFRFDRRSPGNY